MRVTRFISFVIQFATIGLAAAFLVLYFQSQHNPPSSSKEVVELIESARRTDTTITSYVPAVKQAAPAVVNIQTSKIVTERPPALFNDPLFRQFFGDSIGKPRKHMESSLGSGVIISPQGYILTNNHVINDMDEIQVFLKDGRMVKAVIVGTDPESDLAVLHVELDNLPAITLSKADDIEVGDVVLAIGNPFGVGQTVTSGIVSATGRNMLGINTFENFIQTDAAINPGNSGGALINVYGELVGINTAIYSSSGGSQGIGFAIPLSLARNVLTQIIEYGYVKRGWLGVVIQNMSDELAASFKMQETYGVIVNAIADGGPADKAGIKPGDVITHVNGNKIKNVHDLLNRISQILPGKTVVVEGFNADGSFSHEATVIQRPKQEQLQ